MLISKHRKCKGYNWQEDTRNQQAKLKLGTLNYLVNMRPVFNTDALFSDETANYVSPMEPKEGERVTIRFRTERDNVDNVYFISGATKKKMRLDKSRGNFDYYVTEDHILPLKSGKTHRRESLASYSCLNFALIHGGLP